MEICTCVRELSIPSTSLPYSRVGVIYRLCVGYIGVGIVSRVL